jgi:uncharacterized protein involved in outer membrane biogenesis
MNALLQWTMRKRIWLIVAGALLTVYALLGFFLVPRIARNFIENYVRTDLQRNISIGDLTFNPFTLTARVSNLSLTETDGTLIGGFDNLLLNVELMSIVRVGAVFKEIRIDNPHALIRVNPDGSLNLAKLAPPGAEKETPKTDAELPVVRIGVFAMRGGSVTVEDQSRPKPFTAVLAPIEFSLSNFRTEPKYGNAYRFAASTSDGERLEWSGEFAVQPLGSTGRFTLANIKAATISSYLQSALPFNLPTGVLDVEGNYRVAFTDHIDFRLQLPSIKARDVGIALRGDTVSPPWIVVPSLNIAGTSLSLVDRTVSVDEIGVGDAALDMWREADGSINLTKLFADGAPENTALPAGASTPSSADSAPWKIAIKSSRIEKARVNFEDRSVKPVAKFALAPIDITVANYSSEPKSTLNLESSIGVNESGSITAAGPITLSPLAVKLNVAVKGFELAALQPYAANSTDKTIHRGKLTLQSELEYAETPARGQPQIKFTGDIDITDLLTKDNALKEDFIKWQSLRISGLNYQQAPDKLSITRIYARKPYGRVIIASDGTLNITQVLNPKAAATEPAPAESNTKFETKSETVSGKPVMPARIRSVVVEDGSATFADYSVNPSFATEIAELKGSVEGLTSEPNSRAKIQLTGSVDRYAPVSIDGVINLLSTETYSDIALSFRNIELTTFNPYSGKFAGYNISKGKLSTEMQYKVENRNLDAHHHIIVDQLEFGDATGSKDAVSLPIKLAVALLKDRHGVIDLDLPITGNIDDPQFRLGPIIWQVLKNTLEKIVTAPFALLGRLFGGGEDLAYVEFAHGSVVLEQAAAEKLNKLRQAMIERPQLKLDVPMNIFDAADGIALTRESFEAALAAPLKTNPDRVKALAAVYTKEFGKPPVYPEITDKDADVDAVRTNFLEGALLEKFTATPAQIEVLGRGRGNAVRDHLLTGGEIAPERVFLSTRALEEKPQAHIVRMELKVE